MRVYGDIPADAAGVEAPADLIVPPPPGGPRRWGWIPAILIGLAAIAYVRFAPDAGLPEIPWLALAAWLWWFVVAALLLIRYVDDRMGERVRADASAIAGSSLATVGTVTALSDGAATGRGESCLVEFEGPDGETTARWVLPPVPDVRRELPRPGDPIAVWAARDRDAVLLRYERSWAEDILRRIAGQHDE